MTDESSATTPYAPPPAAPTVRTEDVLADAASRHRRLFFRVQPGNAGDALINEGFACAADRLGLRHRVFAGGPEELPERGPDDLVIMTGGGSLSRHYDFGADAVTSWTAQDSPLLIMPSSLNGHAAALRTLRPRDTLMVRDRYSYGYALSLGLRCRLLLADDLAFLVDPSAVLGEPLCRLPRRRDHWRRAAAFAQHRRRAARGETLYAWRVDGESAGERPGARRRDDLSELASFGCLRPGDNRLSAQWLLRVCGWYRRVETDRLHLGVACLLMGTPVVLHGNDHHKIRGVYEQSIAPHPHRRALVEFAAGRDSAGAEGDRQ